MAKLFEPPRYIAVEGPIRVGKTTLANIIADRLNAQRAIEPETNPFLRAFYEGERGARPLFLAIAWLHRLHRARRQPRAGARR